MLDINARHKSHILKNVLRAPHRPSVSAANIWDDIDTYTKREKGFYLTEKTKLSFVREKQLDKGNNICKE